MIFWQVAYFLGHPVFSNMISVSVRPDNVNERNNVSYPHLGQDRSVALFRLKLNRQSYIIRFVSQNP